MRPRALVVRRMFTVMLAVSIANRSFAESEREEFVIAVAGLAAEGSYVTYPFVFGTSAATPQETAYFARHHEKFGDEPSTWSALTYDAVGMAIEAIREAGPDRTRIKDWFASRTTPEKGYAGVTGLTSFDLEGDCYSKPPHVVVVRDGRFQPAPLQRGVERER